MEVFGTDSPLEAFEEVNVVIIMDNALHHCDHFTNQTANSKCGLDDLVSPGSTFVTCNSVCYHLSRHVIKIQIRS